MVNQGYNHTFLVDHCFMDISRIFQNLKYSNVIEKAHINLCTPCASQFCYLCNVKLVTFIVGLYVLTLNAFPCSDTDAFCDNSQTEVMATYNLDHNHSASELCPPFCTCHCCHVHTVEFASVNFKPINTEISSKVFLHFESLGEEPISSLLDPPRV